MSNTQFTTCTPNLSTRPPHRPLVRLLDTYTAKNKNKKTKIHQALNIKSFPNFQADHYTFSPLIFIKQFKVFSFFFHSPDIQAQTAFSYFSIPISPTFSTPVLTYFFIITSFLTSNQLHFQSDPQKKHSSCLPFSQIQSNPYSFTITVLSKYVTYSIQ